MTLPKKWKDCLSIAGALVLVGFYFHVVAVLIGVVVDVIIGLVSGGNFNWPVTRWMCRWWR
jgi:phage-related protein